MPLPGMCARKYVFEIESSRLYGCTFSDTHTLLCGHTHIGAYTRTHTWAPTAAIVHTYTLLRHISAKNGIRIL